MSTILVLDDQPANRDVLVSMLGYRGHRMLQAGDGAQALQMVRSECPDLVIADVLMPGMSGYEFARRLRREPWIGGTPIIFYTANYLEHEAQTLAGRCGVETVLTKTSEPQAIFDAVDHALAPVAEPETVDDAFSREHVHLLVNKLAEKVAALEMSSLRLTAVIRLWQQLAVETTPHRVLAEFCSEAREIVGARFAAVGILSSSRDSLSHLVVSGGDEEAAPSVLAPCDGIYGQILESEQPLRLTVLDRASATVLPVSHRTGPLLGISLKTGTHQLGWLYFTGKTGDGPFTDEDSQIASLLSANLALAYEGATRLEQIRRHAADLERRIAERSDALPTCNASEVASR